MSWREMLWHEWRTRFSQSGTLLVLLLFCALLVYGAMHGKAQRAMRAQTIQQHAAEVAATMQDWLAAAKALEQGPAAGVPPWAASPMDATFASALPVAALADFAIGQSDLLPYVGPLSLWQPDIRLFSRYEFAEPIALALGAFDLSTAVLLILPVLLIVVCFDVLSADRDARRLAHAVAQGATLRRLAWRRLTIRSAGILGIAAAIALLALLFDPGTASIQQRLPYFAAWLCALLTYGVFWIAIIALVIGRNRDGATHLATLFLLWAGLTLLLPAATAGLGEAIYPVPSRIAFLAQARELEIETEREQDAVLRSFVADHPDLSIDASGEVPSYFRISFLAMTTADAATEPALRAFETAAAKRESIARLLGHVSPGIGLHALFADLAGTSAARHRRYVSQARAFKHAYAELAAPYIVAGRRLPQAVAESLPRFHFEDESLGVILARHLPALLLNLLLAAALFALAERRLRRAPVIAD